RGRGLTLETQGLGNNQSSDYTFGYFTGVGSGDSSTLKALTTLTGSGLPVTNGNIVGTMSDGTPTQCVQVSIATGSLGASTYHGELLIQNAGGKNAADVPYFFKFTVALTNQ